MLVVFVVFFLLYGFIFLDRDNMLCINLPSRQVSLSNRLPSFVPIAAEHPNVAGAFVVYTFSGQVESASSQSLKLVSRGGYLPEFKIDSFTPVFRGEGSQAKPAAVSDLAPGVSVMVWVNYYGVNTGWKVNRITIN